MSQRLVSIPNAPALEVRLDDVTQMHEQPAEAASRLVMPLIREMSQEMYDPFAVLAKQEPHP